MPVPPSLVYSFMFSCSFVHSFIRPYQFIVRVARLGHNVLGLEVIGAPYNDVDDTFPLSILRYWARQPIVEVYLNMNDAVGKEEGGGDGGNGGNGGMVGSRYQTCLNVSLNVSVKRP